MIVVYLIICYSAFLKVIGPLKPNFELCLLISRCSGIKVAKTSWAEGGDFQNVCMMSLANRLPQKPWQNWKRSSKIARQFWKLQPQDIQDPTKHFGFSCHFWIVLLEIRDLTSPSCSGHFAKPNPRLRQPSTLSDPASDNCALPWK